MRNQVDLANGDPIGEEQLSVGASGTTAVHVLLENIVAMAGAAEAAGGIGAELCADARLRALVLV